MDKELAAVLERGVERRVVAGVVAVVVDRDGVRYQGCVGERSLGSGIAMSPDTVFAIYSMTKPLTGAVAMQLVERGLLDLDAPAGQICPYLAQVQVLDGFDDRGQPILRRPATPVTLRHLLTHTSGFAYDVWNQDLDRWHRLTGHPAVATGARAGLECPLVFDPGTRWHYGIGIDWVGQMVEAVTGSTLERCLADGLGTPLGLSDTTFRPTEEMLARAASVHWRDGDGALAPRKHRSSEHFDYDAGGSGLWSTAGDYGRFIQMMLGDGQMDGIRVLQPETVEMMSTNQIGDLRVEPLVSNDQDLSVDAEFFPGQPKTWGLTFQINETAASTGRGPGTLMWAGLGNCYFWIDRANGIGGAFLSQLLPFAEPNVVGLFNDFETAVYENR